MSRDTPILFTYLTSLFLSLFNERCEDIAYEASPSPLMLSLTHTIPIVKGEHQPLLIHLPAGRTSSSQK